LKGSCLYGSGEQETLWVSWCELKVEGKGASMDVVKDDVRDGK